MKETKSNLSNQILSEITVFSKYAKYLPDKQRRESWTEIVDRYVDMMRKKYPNLNEEIKTYASFIYDKKILPSMRGLQFAGTPIIRNPSRIYNCAYLPIDDYRAFSESMFLLLGGTGVGYSVQYSHVDKLPEIVKPTKSKRYLVGDSIEGWADAVKTLVKSYLGHTSAKPKFDFSDIRPKGTRLKTAGGKAPGAEPLRTCLFHIETILERKSNGEKLTPVECHDMICHIADSVLSGGIRRSACISLFSFDDEEMLTCKAGNWWELNPQRGRANNSAVIVRTRVKKKEWDSLWAKIEASGSGEPGVYFTNDKDWGTNPCCFTGNTKLLTSEGYKTFKELSEKSDLKLINKDNEVVDGKVWSNGNKDIVRLNLYYGQYIECTPDHILMDNEGNEIEAQYSKGLRLMPHYEINNIISENTKYGFIQGDGATGRLASNTHKGLEIYFGASDNDVANIFGYKSGKQYVNGFNDILKDLGFSSEELPNRTLPKNLNKLGYEGILEFLKGLYSANGSVIKDQRVSFKTTCKELAYQIKRLLYDYSYGKVIAYITTNKAKQVKFSNGEYKCKESYDINISTNQGVLWFAKNIGFIQQYKQNSLINLIKAKAPLVRSVKAKGNQEVFDFNLHDNKHWGVVEGIIVHNCEIALRPYQFCNLCECNVSDIESQDDLNQRVEAATFFGTLQAGYTDFHYLREIWKKTTEKDALIGVGMTGIGSGEILKYDLTKVANLSKEVNEKIANIIGINPAARCTTVKPSGTSSCVLGTSSGIHAWHNTHYLRSIRLGKNESLYTYLAINTPELLEDDFFKSETQAIVRIPQKAPDGAILRTESALDLLERTKRFNLDWVREGHRSGSNTNNVSATISLKQEEWKDAGEWMWMNKHTFNGLSVLNYDGGSYVQAPFQDITEEEYLNRMKVLTSIDLTQVVEIDDDTSRSQEVSCAGGLCSIE